MHKLVIDTSSHHDAIYQQLTAHFAEFMHTKETFTRTQNCDMLRFNASKIRLVLGDG